ncbi:MAG: ATP-binding cassette domain-containing protein, partial [Rickettsiales bacterium]|nr:ATP-binding cassette domain-containing protein [Rickettsiales bacterium]
MLVVENLAVSGGGKEILHGASLELGRAETMVIMGRNGSGKSTLANAIMRNPKLLVTSGRAVFDGQDLAQLATHEIAARGIFFAPQHMPAIDGLAVSSLLKNSANALRAARGKEPLSAPEFARLAKEYSAIAGVPREWMSRAYGAGFSGGEKKIAQCMEMLFSDASLCILDEPDSGADAGAVDR